MGLTESRIVPDARGSDPTGEKVHQEQIARYAFAAQFAPDADVLDVACGGGQGTQWLSKAGAKSVLGLDVAEAAVEQARMRYHHPALSYVVQDALTIDAAGRYDLVTCFGLIAQVTQKERLLDAIRGALRDDGILVIDAPRPAGNARDALSFDDMHGMLKQRFSSVELFFQGNAFSSFVSRSVVGRLDRVFSVTDHVAMDRADHFVFVASNARLPERTQALPTLLMNDDSYVVALEREISTLRTGETIHVARIDELEHSAARLAASAERAGILEDIRRDAAAMRSAMEQLRAQQANVQMERDGFLHRAQQLEKEMRDAVAVASDHERDRTTLAAALSDLDSARRVLAETSARLAETQTEAFVLRQDAARLPDALARASSVENELNALRYRFEQSDATLRRFRSSLSWKLTRPVRWIGRTFGKVAKRRSQPNA